MLQPLLYGLSIGFILCLTLGTVFFALIQNSVDNGYKTGVSIAFGVIVSDSILIAIALFGTSKLPSIQYFSMYTSLLGGTLLMAMGLSSILKSNPKIVYPKTKLAGLAYYFSTGFLLNALNPVNFIVWGVIATKIQSENSYHLNQQLLFFFGCLTSIFITEIGISIGAFKLKKFFTQKVLLAINRITGALFVIFALRLFYGALFIYN
jgi:threonine/homoserine/homoserine lactone efflux protein